MVRSPLVPHVDNLTQRRTHDIFHPISFLQNLVMYGHPDSIALNQVLIHTNNASTAVSNAVMCITIDTAAQCTLVYMANVKRLFAQG